MASLEGQAAVVTGASGAIGGAIARELGRAGANVLILGRDGVRLDAGADAVRRTGVLCEVHAGDLEAQGAADGAVAACDRAFGRVDVLVHAAGAFRGGALESASVDDLDLQWRLNAHVPFLLTRAFLPSLRRSGGQVVFVNSSAGLRPTATCTGYAMSKHALRALADGLRLEENANGVRVLSVFPGRTASAMQEEVCAHFGTPYDESRYMTADDVAVPVVQALQLERTVEMTDIHLRPMQP